MTQKRQSVPEIRAAKGSRKLVMITACDYPSGCLVDASGADMVLVGDSLAMVELGHDDTLSIGMDEMLHHCRAVARGASRALVVADMPFMSFQCELSEAVRNAGRFLKEGRAQAVKVEGPVAAEAAAMVRAGIPVLGHLGLTPQSLCKFGGFKVQSKTAEAAELLLREARALCAAGCFALILEAVPSDVAAYVTREIEIPCIGIGAGPACDGQVLVFHDILGLQDRIRPRFVKRYAELGESIKQALAAFGQEVREGVFPGPEHCFEMEASEKAKLKAS